MRHFVGIFPALDGATGGVQSSGAEAWQGLLDRYGPERLEAVHYSTGHQKWSAVLDALRVRRRPDVVLIWHIGLLKLLPFVDPGCSRGVLFLHGIEAWKQLDVVTAEIGRRLRLILTNSDFTWQRFVENNPRMAACRHRTVHLGLGATVKGVVSPSSAEPHAVMVGRLDARENYKGHREVIASWPAVRERVPGAILDIVGDGTLRPDLEALSRQLHVADSVRFHGEIEQRDRDALIAAARCLALPSKAEGFGLVYIEAMRMGRPCLVSDRDAGREVVNPPEAGLAVDPDSVGDLVGALCRLLSADKAWDDWSRASRARYDGHFTGALFRSRLVTAIDEAAQERR